MKLILNSAARAVIPQWRDIPNLFVSRTFSKVYGLAGFRIGVLMGNATQMQWCGA